MGYFPLPELKGKPNRILVDGKTLNQIAKESGIRLDTVQHRYSRGVRDYEGLTKPSHIRVEHEKAQRKTYSIPIDIIVLNGMILTCVGIMGLLVRFIVRCSLLL